MSVITRHFVKDLPESRRVKTHKHPSNVNVRQDINSMKKQTHVKVMSSLLFRSSFT